MRYFYWLVLLCTALIATPATASEADARKLVAQVVKAAGGEDKLLKLFRIHEQISLGSAPKKNGKVRVSVLEPPEYWWLGKRQRDAEEPARYLAWAWTLRILTAPQSKVDALEEITENDRPAFGLRVSGSVNPPMDLYFDRNDSRLVRIDWKKSIHRFSDWKEQNGVKYPAKCIGYKMKSNKPWYFSQIIELEPLTELPEGLSR